MIGTNMFGKLPGVQNTAEMAIAQAQQASANTAGINPVADPLSATASVAESSGTIQPIQKFLSGAKSVAPPQRFQQGGSFNYTPTSTFSANESAGSTIAPMASDTQSLYASAAAAPDPLNNAISATQQQAVGDIMGNRFTRGQSLEGLI
jgi:hypothetical protein